MRIAPTGTVPGARRKCTLLMPPWPSYSAGPRDSTWESMSQTDVAPPQRIAPAQLSRRNAGADPPTFVRCAVTSFTAIR